MGPQTEEEEFIDPENPLIKTFVIITEDFGSTEMIKTKVDYLWGVKDIDRSEETFWNASYIGEPVFDEKFDPTDTLAQ